MRVETELGACKQRCVTLEGAARTAQREARLLEDALKVNRGVEYDGTAKSLKAEEGGWDERCVVRIMLYDLYDAYAMSHNFCVALNPNALQ